MEQRPLRLGDLVDDYCPRERRVTNHAIVALVNDGIRQTRCTTCDTEHVFKGAKAPRRRKKEEDAGPLVTPEVEAAAADVSEPPAAPAPQPAPTNAPVNGAGTLAANANGNSTDPVNSAPADNATPDVVEEEGPARPEDNAWFVHRPLIRAQLPRTENDQPPPRPIPEFTMHQRSGRGFRDGQGWSNRNSNANGNTANGNAPGRSNGFRGPGRAPFGQGPDQGAGRPRRHGRKRPR
jgi:hypothetical protein